MSSVSSTSQGNRDATSPWARARKNWVTQLLLRLQTLKKEQLTQEEQAKPYFNLDMEKYAMVLEQIAWWDETHCKCEIGGMGTGKDIQILFMRDPDGLNLRRAEQTARKIGAAAEVIEADIRDPRAVETLFDQAVERFGSVEILVNNAGITAVGTALETNPEQWHQVMDTNATATFMMCRCGLPPMIQNGGGSIVNISRVLEPLLLKLNACFSVVPTITSPKSFTGLSTTMEGALSCPERTASPNVKHIHIVKQNRFISAPDEKG